MLAVMLSPTSLLPWPLQIVSWCLPLTDALAGVRGGVSGLGLNALEPDAIGLAVTTSTLGVAIALHGHVCTRSSEARWNSRLLLGLSAKPKKTR